MLQLARQMVGEGGVWVEWGRIRFICLAKDPSPSPPGPPPPPAPPFIGEGITIYVVPIVHMEQD
jgi:hypothetical protein